VASHVDGPDLADLPPVLTVRDVSRALRIGLRQAYDLTWQGHLVTFKVGRSVRITRTSLADFIASAETEVGR
jgi:excisionase family DNA binding protein